MERNDMNDSTPATARAAGKTTEPSLAELQAQLKTSPDGLSQNEARRRVAQYGYNELPEKKRNPFLEFCSHFWGPIPWMIEAAAILSALVQHWADFIIILVLLLANAVVGFWEEFQAGNAIAALKANLALKARVKRDRRLGRNPGPRTGAGRPGPAPPRRHRAGGREIAGRRPGRSGPIRADRRIAAGRQEIQTTSFIPVPS